MGTELLTHWRQQHLAECQRHIVSLSNSSLRGDSETACIQFMEQLKWLRQQNNF
jgi:hypothetical protein